MAIPANVYPSSLTWLGVGRELTVGTPVAPGQLIPLDKGSYEPEDTPTFLADQAIRYSMASMYGQILGPEDATFSYGGPVFGDVYGYFFDNLFGDLSTTGTTDSTASSTLSAATAVKATSLTVAAGSGFAQGQNVQVGTGSNAEVVTLSAVSTNTLTFTGTPLRYVHASGDAVATVVGPFTHTFATLNSDIGYGGGQPPTLTATDYTGITPTVGARSYPSLCVGQVDLTINAEQLFTAKVTGNSWISQAAAAKPTPTTQFVVPVPAWRTNITVNGSQAYNIGEVQLSIKRDLQVYWTDQGSQNPFIIARGVLDATGSMNYTVATDETPLTQMLSNTQPEVVITLDNGLSGANQVKFTITMTKTAFTKAKPTRSDALVGYEDEFQTVANLTDVGATGGWGQLTVELINNVPTY
jgi:hypothetical protein